MKLGRQHNNRQGATHEGVVATLIEAARIFAGNTDPETGANVKAFAVSMSCNSIGAPIDDEQIYKGCLL